MRIKNYVENVIITLDKFRSMERENEQLSERNNELLGRLGTLAYEKMALGLKNSVLNAKVQELERERQRAGAVIEHYEERIAELESDVEHWKERTDLSVQAATDFQDMANELYRQLENAKENAVVEFLNDELEARR